MFEIDTLSTKLRTVIRTSLGMPANSVRPSFQDAPVTDIEPFATVAPVSVTRAGWEFSETKTIVSTDQVEQELTAIRSVLFSVNFYRAGALNNAERLPAALQSAPAQEFLQKEGMGIGGFSATRLLSVVVSDHWEERAQIDVTVNVMTKHTVTLETFGTFPIELTINGNTNSSEVNEP